MTEVTMDWWVHGVELVGEVLAWPSMIVQIGVALWVLMLTFGMHVLCRCGKVSFGRMAFWKIKNELKLKDTLSRSATRFVGTSGLSAPAVRSVDIQPVVAAMRVRQVQLSPWSSTRPLKTTSEVAVKASNASISSSVSSSTATARAPVVNTRETRTSGAQRSITSRRTQANGSGSEPSHYQQATNESEMPSTRVQWKVSVWTVMVFSVLVLLMKTTIASAEAVADAFPLASAVQSELYIVLVSIPVLDKVLPLKNLAEELLHRGYRVGFALPENCWHWVSDLEHLEFISLGNIVGKGRATYSDHQELQALGIYESYATTLRYYASFQGPMFNALVEDLEEDPPDLLVVDRYTFAGFDAAQRLDIPFVVNNPSLLMDIDSPPAYVGAPFSNISMHTPSAWERCLNSFYRLRFRLAMVQVFKEVNQNRRDQQLPPVESKEELYGGTLVLTSSMFGLDEPRPIAPQFQMIGMLQSPHHRRTPPLPIDFEYWLATNPLNKPVIFISFPSNIPLAPEFVTTLMDGLDNIGARVVWRITLQEQAAFDLRSRSRASVFFLGDDVDDTLVLEQTPVSLLITAGDLHTMQQALVVGVPILGVSFSSEQWEAVNGIVRAGAGLHVTSKTFSETTVREATDQLLHKPSYSVAAFHLGELLKTGGGTQRAADHVVSVAQFGASHVLPARNLQPLYKTYLVDVYFIYGIILCGAAVILRTCFAVLYSIFQIAPDVHLGVTLDPPDEPVTEPMEKSL